MVTKLSELAHVIEQGAVPGWLVREVEARKDQIAQQIAKGETVTLHGPHGETVTIKADESQSLAASAA